MGKLSPFVPMLLAVVAAGVQLSGCDGDDEPSCKGTATPCAALAVSVCVEQDDCGPEGSCTGAATSCSSLLSSSSCASQQGCTWSSLNGECSGIAMSCSLLSETMCWGQMGCVFDLDTCAGQVRECSEYTDWQDCEAQDGCEWR